MSLKSLVFIVLMCAFWSCDEEVDGCLDYRALSIQVDADNPCEDCCKYPSLRLQTIPGRIFPDTTLLLRKGSELFLGNDTATLGEIAYYLYEIALVKADGSLYPLSDTLSFRINDEKGFQQQQISLARMVPTGASISTIGQLLEAQEVVAIQATLGLPVDFEMLHTDAQFTTSKLNGGPDTLLRESGGQTILSAGFRLVRDTIRSNAALPVFSRFPVRWELPEPIDLPLSYNLNVTLVLPVDNLLALDNTDFTAQEFAEKLLIPARILAISVAR